MFTVNGAARAQIGRFLEMQDSLTNEAGIFARRWFERRNQAIETAIEALLEMNSTGASDPAQAMTEWQRGAGAATTAQFDAIETGAGRAEADKAHGKAASKASSDHATPARSNTRRHRDRDATDGACVAMTGSAGLRGGTLVPVGNQFLLGARSRYRTEGINGWSEPMPGQIHQFTKDRCE